jgi:signal transduction histidine kinase/CheY-like chemotaxis protein/ligand-binding sensor domain-containing protein/AraC-like DNA-binding protein
MPGIVRLLLGLLFCSTLTAQSLPFQTITVSDGLSQGFITALHQDRNGFLWIGTLDGLNRYDGYSIKRFNTQPFDPYSISDNAEITAILEDVEGLLWIGTSSSLYIFDPATEFFYNLRSTLPLPTELGIYQLVQLSPRQLLLMPNPQEVYLLTLPNQLAQPLRSKAELALSQIQIQPFTTNSLLEQEGLSIASSNDSLFFLPNKSLRKVFYYFNPATNTLQERPFPFTPPVFWQGRSGQHHLLGRRSELLPPIQHWGTIFKTDENDYLISQYMDLSIYRTSKPALPEGTLNTNPIVQPILQGSTIISRWMVDQSNVLWLGTTGHGLRKANLQRPSFHHFLEGKSVYNLKQLEDGRIWFGKHFPYHLLNPKTGQLEWADWKETFNNKRIHNLHTDRKGNRWFICHDYEQPIFAGIFFWEKTTQQFTQLLTDLPQLPHVAEQILEDRSGNIWIAGHNGVVIRFSEGSKVPQKWSCQPLFNSNQKEIRTNAIHQDHQGRIWIGTSEGLIKVEKTSEATPIFHLYHHEPGNPTSLNTNRILSLTQLPNDPDALWIGTRGGGINRFDIQSGTCTYLLEQDGLPNNVVYGLLPDQQNQLWGSTNRGLFRFHTQLKSFIQYQESDGLQSAEFNSGAFLVTSNGRMMFGGINGISDFNPAEIQPISKNAKVAITQIKVLGEPLPIQRQNSPLHFAPHLDQTLRLPHHQNNITFEFSALHFSNPATNQYRYQLVGVDPAWIYSGTTRIANYSNLAPGSYQFKVQGKPAHAEWSNEVSSLHLVITPPWYQTTWAILGFFLLAGLGITYFIRHRENLLRVQHQQELEHQENERLKEIDRFKNRFLTNITHEFRTPLTIIQGLAQRILGRSTALEEKGQAIDVLKQSQHLLELVNQMLDLAKLEEQQLQLHPTLGEFRAFLEKVTDSCQPLAAEKNIRILLKLPSKPLQLIFDPLRMQQVFSNILSNALRFSPENQEIILQLDTHERWCTVSISDQGPGIPEQELPHLFDRYFQGKQSNRSATGGIGLALAKELVLLAGGTINAQNRPNGGAIFQVHLPISTPNNTLINKPTTSSNLPLLLVIEDHPELANYLKTCLQQEYQLVFAQNGTEGIEKATQLVPDLILADVMMPLQNGYELTAFLKKQAVTSHIPIVLLTAKAQTEDRLQGYQAGANAYLTKPFLEEELLLLLRNQLHLLEALRDRKPSNRNQTSAEQALEVQFPLEDAFLQQIHQIMEKEYANPDYSLNQLCKNLGMSSSQLHRKLSAITNQTAMGLLRNVRLKKAYQLLQTDPHLTVAQVSLMVGFNNPNHFSRVFSKAFGIPPSELK